MALEQQRFTVPFAEGQDTATDSKLLQPTKLEVLENGVWVKKGTVSTRPGHEALSRNISGGGSLSSGRTPLSYNNELLQVSSKNLYGFSDQNDNWVNHGTILNCPTTAKSIIQNKWGQAFQDSARSNNIELYIWIDTRNRSVRASVYDTTSDCFIIADTSIFDQGGTFSYTPSCRAVAIGQYLFAVYSDGANLRAKRLDTSNPSAFEASFDLATDLNTTSHGFDIVEYDSGAAAFCYVKTANTTMDVGYLKSDKTIGNGSNGYAAPVTITDTFETNSMQILKEPDDLSVWVIYVSRIDAAFGGTQALRFFARNASLTSKVAVTTITSGTVPVATRIGAVWADNSTIRVMFDVYTSSLADLKTCTITDAGVASAVTTFLHQACLASHPFVDSGVVYVNLLYGAWSRRTGFGSNPTEVSSQRTVCTVRFSDWQVVARYFPSACDMPSASVVIDGESGELTTNVFCLPRIVNPSSGKYAFPILIQSSYYDLLDSVSNGNYSPNDGLGIFRVDIDMVTESIILSDDLGEDKILVPGILHHYDGANLVENNFFIYPEGVNATTGTGFSSAVFQQGTGALPEIKDITCGTGAGIPPNSFILIPNAAGTFRSFGFIVDGIGNSSAFDGAISIFSADTATQVATAVKNTIDAHADFIATNPSSTVVRVQNAANGNVSDVVGLPGAGTLPAGTYNYTAVYAWAGQNGELHRSAPSSVVTVTIGSALQINLQIPCLWLTKKRDALSPVVIEVYRTTKNGTIFYKLPRFIFSNFNFLGSSDSEDTQLKNRTDLSYVYFQDGFPDSSLVDNEIIYIQGGTVENISPPDASCVVVGRQRAFLTGFKEFPNQVWMSKRKQEGVAISFNDSSFIDIDPLGGPNRCLAFFDEKYILFQDTAILWWVGEGFNDIGLDANFTEPQFISKDIGCDDPQSICFPPIGLMFKSQKGWYLIDHGLNLIYIGERQEAMNALNVTSAVVMKDKHLVKWTHSDGAMSAYDYSEDAWSTNTGLEAVGAVLWRGVYCLLRSDGKIWKESSTTFKDDGTAITLKAVTSWIQTAGIRGFQRIWKLLPLGLFKPNYNYVVKTKLDYDESTISDNVTFTTAANATRFRMKPKEQKCEAFKLQMEAVATTGDAASEFSGVTIEAGVKRGVAKQAAAQTIG